MYEHCFKNLNVNIWSRLRRCRAPLIGFSGETYHPLGVIDLRVTMGEAGRNKTMLMEFAIVKFCSPYNVIIGRTGMRSLRAIGSTIYSMIKFPTNQGIMRMETSREALWECRQLERVQGEREGSPALSPIVRTSTRNRDSYTLTEKMVQSLIHTTRFLRTTFRKHKVTVVTDGPIEEILKLFERKGPMKEISKARVGNYKPGIPQSGSIGRYQNKTIGRGNKQQQERERSKQRTRGKTKLQSRS
ncbi:hypothetical protein Tco_1372287 [Tanacetum coccineum]